MTELKQIIPIRRNVAEYAAIGGWWLLLVAMLERSGFGATVMTVFVIVGCWTKAVLFGAENMQQLFDAAKRNLPHHHFLLVMAVNMSQMILSFMFDFQLLQRIDPTSFSGVAPSAGLGEALFDFFYLSTLNFSFFGYSDILPQTVAARIANLTEIVLAFVTVIFLLSDFISLKDSLRRDPDGTS